MYGGSMAAVINDQKPELLSRDWSPSWIFRTLRSSSKGNERWIKIWRLETGGNWVGLLLVECLQPRSDVRSGALLSDTKRMRIRIGECRMRNRLNAESLYTSRIGKKLKLSLFFQNRRNLRFFPYPSFLVRNHLWNADIGQKPMWTARHPRGPPGETWNKVK